MPRRFLTLRGMPEKAQVLRGPWAAPSEGEPRRLPRARALPQVIAWHGASPDADSRPGRLMLGFVIRECAVALGHAPTPRELADWANHQQDARGEFCLFGREITREEARVILKHPGREVTVRPERCRPRGAASTD